MNESMYLVWSPSGGYPMRQHDSISSAQDEARRLAELNKGQEFIVLRAIQGVTYCENPWRTHNFCKS